MNSKNFGKARKLIFVLVALILTVGLLFPASSTQALPQKAQPVARAVSAQPPTDQIIIKYLSGSVPANPDGATQMDRLSTAASTSLSAAGATLSYLRKMSATTYVLQLSKALPLTTVQTICTALMTLSEVEYAEPDKILRHADNIPSESGAIPPAYYGNQWFYSGPFGINAPAAWGQTTGSSNIVVAVLDTGLMVGGVGSPNQHHPDFDFATPRVVSGYDFIGNNIRSGDGNDGRDAFPNDAGDYVTSTENSTSGGLFYGCGVSLYNSWHGTHVAGIIGAWTNNAAGVAGVNWVSRILPVRVLGKCGGYVSDIADGMRWAAGLSVEGVADNPAANRAQVINLSLGGAGTCSKTEQSAIDDVVAAGSVVVAAAGNDTADANTFSPGNCNGVITVASTNSEGLRSSFSNYGSTVEISAPGGESGGGGIYSTSNPGLTTWDTSYISDATDSRNYEYKSGTSMAAAVVSGVVSLMFSVNPNLTRDETLQILQGTARAFSGTPGSTPLCTTSTCGAGIVDANAAVMVAAMPDLAVEGVTFSLPSDPATLIDPAKIDPTKAFNINITVGNPGGAPINISSDSQSRLYIDPGSKNSKTIPSSCPSVSGITADDSWVTINQNVEFPSGARQTYTYNVQDAALTGGGHKIYAYADANCVVNGEGLESNNAYGPITVGNSPTCTPPVGGAQVFADVPTNYWARDYIEAMYYCGYTAGCSVSGPLLFCPETLMNRAQSAVFLLRSKYGQSYVYPSPPYTAFHDDFSPAPWTQPWAQGLFDAGMTAGCATTPFRFFCPFDLATQEQLAVFGLRMKFGDTYAVPAGTGTVFADMPASYWATGWAEQAYANDLIRPCGTQGGRPLFCPQNLVDRASASYTIVKAKNLLP